MARVARLSLSHFRSHRSTRLDLPTPITAIHGANGSGKTNLLEAVSLLSPGRGMRRAAPEDVARRPEAIGWRVAATIDGSEPGPDRSPHRHEVEIRAEPDQPRATRIDGKAAPQVALARLLRVLWLVPAMDRLWLDGAEGRRRFLDRAAMSFAPDHADGVLAYEKAMRDRNRLLRDGVGDAGWFDALEWQMARSGAAIDARRRDALDRLAAAQDDGGPFPAADLALAGPDGPAAPATEDALRDAFAGGRRRDAAAGRTLAGPHRADLDATYAAKGMAARLCSTGEQKALLIALVLANARALAAMTGAPPVLLLDEVAAHLDDDRRRALYDALHALGAQAFLTATDAALYDGLDGALRLRVRDAGGDSRVEAVA